MRFRTTIKDKKNSAISTMPVEKVSTATGLKRAAVLPWIAQVLIAALLLCAVGKKVASPIEILSSQSHPGLFMKFIGLAEALGDRSNQAASARAGRADDGGRLEAGK